MGPRDHVAECSEVLLFEPALHRREDAGDLMAASDDLGIVEDILRLGDARHRHFAALKRLHVVRVSLGRDEFVMAAIHEFEQVAEELTDIRRSDEMLETKFADSTAEIDPQILLIENAEIFVRRFE